MKRTASLHHQFTAATVGRLVLNTMRRFFYPFAPALSRGLGVPLAAVTTFIAINQATGLLSPLFGPLSDRWGYRSMLLLAMALMAGGMLAGGIFPVFGVIMLAAFLAGLAKSIFDPALHAYVGSQVPFERRGLVVGLTEISWAASTLIGLPLLGFLIARFNWQTPFLVMGVLSLGVLLWLWLVLPRRSETGTSIARPTIPAMLQSIGRDRSVWGAMGFAFAFSAANDVFFVIYGLWLETDFSLSVAVLGATTIIIGLAELSGEGLVVLFADRLGLRRSLLVAIVITAVLYLGLPLTSRVLWLALGAMFVLFVVNEYAFVSAISLFTELKPAARGSVMAGYLAFASLGRIAGALLGVPAWQLGGMWAVGVTSMALAFLAFGMLWLGRSG